jgi:hypothetical protein
MTPNCPDRTRIRIRSSDFWIRGSGFVILPTTAGNTALNQNTTSSGLFLQHVSKTFLDNQLLISAHADGSDIFHRP